MVHWWGVYSVLQRSMLLLMIVTILLYIYISVMYQIVHEKISDLQDHHMLMPSTENKKKKEATFHSITKPCFMTLKKK